jgi:hypothetical protein
LQRAWAEGFSRVEISEQAFSTRAKRERLAIVVAITSVALIALFVYPPVSLGPRYHIFADNRTVLGIPNGINVLSNIPFMIVGLWGSFWLASASSARAFHTKLERLVYSVFFWGVAITGVGSFWYHIVPNNDRLPFDLLPMTCSYMAMLTAITIERLGGAIGRAVFAPLLILGCASVGYWYLTEMRGHGDYRFYLFVQFFPPLLIGTMIFLFPPTYTGTKYLVAAFVLFVIAKILEICDDQIYRSAHVVSGHALKHVTAAIACYPLLLMLQRRHAVAISSSRRVQASA